MSRHNQGAYFPSKGARLEVRDAPYTPPQPRELVIRNHAAAINPMDWKIQDADPFGLAYPKLIGADAAGEVVEVGSEAARRFKVGDRVLGQATGAFKDDYRSAFQLYTNLIENIAVKIPDSLSFADAAVIPLGLGTASCALFQKEFLALQHPSVTPKPTGQTVFIWGGSTSCGANAIQLAVAAGYEVVSTASPRNFELVKKLGARVVFDYNSPSLVDDVVAACKGANMAGAFDTISENGTVEKTVEILHRSQGVKFVATVLGGTEQYGDVASRRVMGSTLVGNEVGKAVYEDFLEPALAAGKFIPAPSAKVVGHGLEFVQTGIDELRNGVSATKLVVTL